MQSSTDTPLLPDNNYDSRLDERRVGGKELRSKSCRAAKGGSAKEREVGPSQEGLTAEVGCYDREGGERGQWSVKEGSNGIGVRMAAQLCEGSDGSAELGRREGKGRGGRSVLRERLLDMIPMQFGDELMDRLGDAYM